MSTTPVPDPTVKNRAPSPPGNIPKGRQTWIMLGIALVIVLAVIFSGSTATPAKPANNLPPLTVTPPTKGDIDRYKRELAEQEAAAAAAQRQMKEAAARFNQQTGAGNTGTVVAQPVLGSDGRPYYPAAQNTEPVAAAVPQKSPMEQEKEKLEFTSLFASNIALSLRPPHSAAAPQPSVPVQPAADGLPPRVPQPAAAGLAASRSQLKTGQHILFEGTVIESVLTNRLAGSFSGPVNCMVTSPVYSHDHDYLLIPPGSRVLGEAKRVAEQQQQRLAVMFHRLIMPDGYSVDLDVLGLDQAGATGLKDKTDNHYLKIFGTSIALGLMAGFSQFGTGSALAANGTDIYRQGVASQLSQNSSTVLNRELNQLPTITVREGQRVKIFLTKDLELPRYESHPGRGDP